MNHYFINDPNLKSKEQLTFANVKNKEYKFITDNGVFSKKGLDFGTRSLLEALPYEKIKGDILDFGCGYGPIGIIIQKITNQSVDMLDINKRSMELAIKNAELNKVNVHIFESNLYEKVEKKYDFIITNPPIRVGKEILYQILNGAYDYLKPNGSLICVIHKDQGAKSVAKELENKYEVQILDKNKGFYIIEALKR